jgi:hypothetical protein
MSGFKTGDVLDSLNGTPIATFADLQRMLRSLRTGDTQLSNYDGTAGRSWCGCSLLVISCHASDSPNCRTSPRYSAPREHDGLPDGERSEHYRALLNRSADAEKLRLRFSIESDSADGLRAALSSVDQGNVVIPATLLTTHAADSRKFNVLSAWSLIHTQNTNERTCGPDR